MPALQNNDEFHAQNVAYWRVDGSDLTLVTDADLPLGQIRQRMVKDAAANSRAEISLPCVHWSNSFLGESGTYIHGVSWKLHKPKTFDKMDLWQSLDYASLADWTEVALPAEKTEPTADEAAGIDWWNDLTERERAAWCSLAGSAVPADAWALHKGCPSLEDSVRWQTSAQRQPANGNAVSVHRAFSGVEIDGADFAILVAAQCDSLLGMRITAKAHITGLGQDCNIGGDDISRLSFGLGHIQVSDNSLECFAPSESTPLYLSGFKVAIDGSMAESLRLWLPRVAKTAALAAAMARKVDQVCCERVHHLHGFTTDVAAEIVLDGKSPANALASVKSAHWLGNQSGEVLDTTSAKFVGAFDSDELQACMATAEVVQKDAS